MKTRPNTIALIATARNLANAYLQGRLEKAGLAGLAPTHGSIIDALMKQGDLPMRSLAERIRRDKSTVTALVKKLERLGYVRRRTAETDSRLVMIGLTRKGKALEETFNDISAGMFTVALDDVSDAEVRRLEATLTKIIANFTNGGH